MELVKPVEPVLWACIVELVMGGTGYGTVEALVSSQLALAWQVKLQDNCFPTSLPIQFILPLSIVVTFGV